MSFIYNNITMEKITRILVMSDTHGLKQDEVTKIIENEHCDYNIIHRW